MLCLYSYSLNFFNIIPLVFKITNVTLTWKSLLFKIEFWIFLFMGMFLSVFMTYNTYMGISEEPKEKCKET